MDYLSGWCRSQRKLNGITAIITGSNSGIGKETALDFYRRGATVIMACRDVAKAQLAERDIIEQCRKNDNLGELIVEELDVAKLKSVRDFANRMQNGGRNIQILINNAGVMMHPKAHTEDGFELHMGTNHFGPAFLTLLLLPTLRKNAPSRIVFVSSILHERFPIDLDDMNLEKTEYNSLKAYSRSKVANVLYARALAQKLKEHSIEDVTTYSLHPGVIRTEIGRHFSDNYFGTTWVFNNFLGALKLIKSPKCGAQTTIYCAIDEACAKESGLYYSDCAVKPSSKQTQDDRMAARIWDITIDALQLKNAHVNPFNLI